MHRQAKNTSGIYAHETSRGYQVLSLTVISTEMERPGNISNSLHLAVPWPWSLFPHSDEEI